MSCFKKRVSRSFSRASESYDQVGSVQKQCVEALGNMVKALGEDFSVIHDLGSGTGSMIAWLLRHYPDAEYTANDIAPGMLGRLSQNIPDAVNVKCILGDMETVDLGPADLTTCSLALQWLPNPMQVVSRYAQSSKVLAFNFLRPSSFRSLRNFLQKFSIEGGGLSYLELKDLDCVNQWGAMCYEEKSFTLKVDNGRAMLEYIRRLGAATALRSDLISVSTIKAMLEYTSPILMEYDVGFVVVRCR